MYKLGIVGFGVVGKSILAFLNRQRVDCAPPSDQNLFDEAPGFDCVTVRVWDSRMLTPEELAIIGVYKASAVESASIGLRDFIKDNDFIIASPGVSLNDYREFDNKILCELDFFSAFFAKPVVAITGSLGKTTITKVLGKLISSIDAPVAGRVASVLDNQFVTSAGKSCLQPLVGGNVGIGMLDLIPQQDAYDLGILELSSFQLEQNKKFAPDVAVWTNWYPNHLDRHNSPRDYFEAKYNLFRFQTEKQVAVMAAELFDSACGPWLRQRLGDLKSMLYLCSTLPLSAEFIASVPCESFYLMYLDNGLLFKALVRNGLIERRESLCHMPDLPDITFVQNWVHVFTVLHVIGIDLYKTYRFLTAGKAAFTLEDHHHRCEHFATIQGVDFYDDSKSTIIQATIAAFKKIAFQKRPIILIVGGLAKGVDRSAFFQSLLAEPGLKQMYCFGKECVISTGCTVCADLEEVLKHVANTMEENDIVLFSPSGASFDFFKNYEHRGDVFKQLVKKLADTSH